MAGLEVLITGPSAAALREARLVDLVVGVVAGMECEVLELEEEVVVVMGNERGAEKLNDAFEENDELEGWENLVVPCGMR